METLSGGRRGTFHAYIFVYDASVRDSFLEMNKLFNAVESREKSDLRGQSG